LKLRFFLGVRAEGPAIDRAQPNGPNGLGDQA
jgi:hypothetical protein